jgi:transposase
MARAISIDLRKRVVEAYQKDPGGYSTIAKRFNVGRNSVRRWVALSNERGDISPLPHGGGPTPKIRESQFAELELLVQEKPDRSLVELSLAWNSRSGGDVHRSSMDRALKRARLSRKKRPLGRSKEIVQM